MLEVTGYVSFTYGGTRLLAVDPAVLFDPRDEFDALQRHKAWHEATDPATPTQHEETP